MMNTLQKLFILIASAFIGWFSIYFIKAHDFTSSSISKGKTSEENTALKQYLSSSSYQTFTRSTDPSYLETLNKNVDSYSFEEILEIDDIYLREALLEKRLSTVSLEELSSLMQLLYELDENGSSKNFIFAFHIWIDRDFESAKAFITEEFDFNQDMASHYMRSYSLSFDFFPVWMNKNVEECTAFLEKLAEKPAIMKSAMLSLINDYPETVFSVLEKMSGFTGFPEGQMHVGLYEKAAARWYEKEPENAIERILKMENLVTQREALTGLLVKMATIQPEKALVLMREHTSADGSEYGVYKIIDSLSRENPSQALDFIRQGALSEKEQNIAYKALTNNLNPSDLRTILDDVSLLITEEERRHLIRLAFGTTALNKSSNITEIILPRFQSAIDDLETEIKVALFNELSSEDKVALIKEMKKGAYYVSAMPSALILFEQIPDEQKNINDIYYFLGGIAAYDDPAIAANYYVASIYGKTFTDTALNQQTQGKEYFFFEIMEHFVKQKPQEAIIWTESLTNDNLKRQATLAIALNDTEKNPAKMLGYLESFEDQKLAKNIFLNTSSKLAQGNTQELGHLLIQTTNESWAKEAALQAISQIQAISEDIVLDFIDSLSSKPSIQDEARLSYIENIQHSSPLKALNTALEISNKERKNDTIKTILENYEKTNPDEAKQWIEKHRIIFSTENSAQRKNDHE